MGASIHTYIYIRSRKHKHGNTHTHTHTHTHLCKHVRLQAGHRIVSIRLPHKLLTVQYNDSKGTIQPGVRTRRTISLTLHKILLENHKIIGLGCVAFQAIVLGQETQQLGRGSVIGQAMCLNLLSLHHVFEKRLSQALSLPRRSHEKVEDTQRADLLVGPNIRLWRAFSVLETEK